MWCFLAIIFKLSANIGFTLILGILCMFHFEWQNKESVLLVRMNSNVRWKKPHANANCWHTQLWICLILHTVFATLMFVLCSLFSSSLYSARLDIAGQCPISKQMVLIALNYTSVFNQAHDKTCYSQKSSRLYVCVCVYTNTFFCVFTHRLIKHRCTGTHVWKIYILICIVLWLLLLLTLLMMMRDPVAHIHTFEEKKTVTKRPLWTVTRQTLPHAMVVSCSSIHISFSAGSLKITINAVLYITMQLDLELEQGAQYTAVRI